MSGDVCGEYSSQLATGRQYFRSEHAATVSIVHDKLSDPMSLNEYDHYLDFSLQIAKRAGKMILPYFRADIDVANKAQGGDYDPVTLADQGAETMIRNAIEQAFPTHGVRGEEHGIRQGTSPYTWVIDPIDGTRSFILGQLHWATLIALNDGVRPVLGVVHQPFVGESFVGAPGVAEWRRGAKRKVLRTRGCGHLKDAVVCTTHPQIFQKQSELAAFQLVAANARLVRYGGDCYSYCLLAAGLVDLVIESSLQPYDIQALIPIVEAAGGVISDWSGAPCHEGGQIIAAGDPAIHKQALSILKWAV